MADIRQAAQWMKEGKTVRRGPEAMRYSAELNFRKYRFGKITDVNGEDCYLTLDSLLSDDWELAE
jgi:hypothetical protein